jgi:predicted transcriptional regulator with HTH domain
MAKTIKIWNNQKNCAEYLHSRYPTVSFIDEIMYCLKLDETEVKRVSAGLKLRGINHEIIEVEGNH